MVPPILIRANVVGGAIGARIAVGVYGEVGVTAGIPRSRPFANVVIACSRIKERLSLRASPLLLIVQPIPKKPACVLSTRSGIWFSIYP